MQMAAQVNAKKPIIIKIHESVGFHRPSTILHAKHPSEAKDGRLDHNTNARKNVEILWTLLRFA